MKALCLILALVAGNAWGAIAVDGSCTSGFSNGSPTSLTFAYTSGSGANRILVVGCSALPAAGVETITATWNGQSMTQLTTTAQTLAVGLPYTKAIFYLLNPAAGTTANVVISYNVAGSPAAWAQGYSGVNQSTPFGNIVYNSGTTGSLASSVTTTYANSQLLCDFTAYFNGGSITWDATLTPICGSGGLSGETSAGKAATTIGSYSVTNTYTAYASAAAQYLVEMIEQGAGTTPVQLSPYQSNSVSNWMMPKWNFR